MPSSTQKPNLTGALAWSSDGNVGIGTNAPDKKLTVVGEIKTTAGIRFPDGTLQITAGGSGGGSGGTPALGSITPEMLSSGGPYWASSGNLGIGTTNTSGGRLSLSGANATQIFRIDESTSGYTYTQGLDDTGVYFKHNSASRGFRWIVNNTVESFRVDQNGNVGIGTTNPGAYKLNVSGASVNVGATGTGNPSLQAVSSDAAGIAYLAVGNNTRNWGIRVEGSSGALTIRDNTAIAERLRIDSNGNVGIGRTTPSAGFKLDVAGQIAAEYLTGTSTGFIDMGSTGAPFYTSVTTGGSSYVPAVKIRMFGAAPQTRTISFGALHNTDNTIDGCVHTIDAANPAEYKYWLFKQNGSIQFPDGTMQTTAAMPSSGMKNRIINGGMTIDQINNSAVITIIPGTKSYVVDQFFGGSGSSGTGVFTLQQTPPSTIAPPPGLAGAIRAAVTTTDAAPPAGQFYGLAQCIEGRNCVDLAWGTSAAATVTLSFWVRSSVTGIFGGSLRNDINAGANYRSYPFTYTISAANTWEQKAITIPGDTTGPWKFDNSIGITLTFSFGEGTNYKGSAGAWTSGNYHGAAGTVNLMATSGATWYITGVQLEKGSTATTFDYRAHGIESMLCMRYYEIVRGGASMTWSSGTYAGTNTFKVEKRATPTIQLGSAYYGYPDSTNWQAINVDVHGFGVQYGSNGSNLMLDALWKISARF